VFECNITLSPSGTHFERGVQCEKPLGWLAGWLASQACDAYVFIAVVPCIATTARVSHKTSSRRQDEGELQRVFIKLHNGR